MNITFQTILILSIRAVATFLFFWWAMLYLGYASLEPLGIRDIFAAIVLGAMQSFSLFISTLPYRKPVPRLMMALLIILGFVNALYLSMDKWLWTDFLGVVFHILAMICFVKLNFPGGINGQYLHVKTGG